MTDSTHPRPTPAHTRAETTPLPPLARSVLAFWREAGPTRWFAKNAAFDADFRTRFAEAHFAAARGELMSWLAQPESALALIILLDQYPRNAFRGTAHMYATDGLALACARKSLPFITDIEPELRNFLCLPFVHAEDLAMQEQAVAIYEAHIREPLRWTVLHRDIIARFGRFPHRNAMLGRETTAEEQAFLDEGGFSG